MKRASNTGSNTGRPNYSPTDTERDRLKAEHRIGWHPRGGWCRKFPGDLNRTYFGRVPPADAVRACVQEEDRRRRGEQAEARITSLTVREALNFFLNHLDEQHTAGKIGDVQRASYGDELDRFVNQVGKTRRLSDFTKLTAPEALFAPLRATAIARGVFAAEKHIVQVRTFLEWCSTVRRFMPAPFYADAFDAPGEREKRAAKRAERKAKGVAYWKPEEVREIVAGAEGLDPHFHAQTLLVLNGGLGATDLALLDEADVDWDRRCIHTERSKTLVPRVVPLWDVTIDAMKASRALRAEPKDPAHANRFFLTKAGRPLVVTGLVEGRKRVSATDSIRNKFYKLMNGGERKRWKAPAVRLKHLKRHRGGFYTLRSVFTTLSMGHGQDRNLEAVILGQQFDRPILEFYIRDDQREKLVGIVEHVRRQIWPDAPVSQ
jgi:integrase